jgi:hypothetical protein
VMLPEAVRSERRALAEQLVKLADTVEDETRDLRDRYLETASSIDGYREVLGDPPGGAPNSVR